MVRVAVIGAGASGLTALKACLEEGLDAVCYEKTEDLGGLWTYREHNVDGVASVMFSTTTNSSKELSAFSDFPPPSQYPNYMHHSLVCQYLNDYADTFGLRSYVRCLHSVTKVNPTSDHDETGRWELLVHDIEQDTDLVETFDAVMVCTGYDHTPVKTEFPGLKDRFRGRVMHVREYKRPVGFVGAKVLVVGLGNSGCDVAVELSAIADSVYVSTRRGCWTIPRVALRGEPFDTANVRRSWNWLFHLLPYSIVCSVGEHEANQRFDHTLYNLAAQHRIHGQHATISDALPSKILNGTVVVKGDVRCFTEDGVFFEDDHKVATVVDVVILATGYTAHFPFIDDSVLPVRDNRVRLYKYVFPSFMEKGTLAFIGAVQPEGSLFPISEMQSRWVAGVFAGRYALPAVRVMEEDVDQRELRVRERYIPGSRHARQVDWIEYMDEMAELVGCKPRLGRLLLTDPVLAWACVFGPCLPYQYRLNGPGSWPRARQQILDFWENYRLGLETRKLPWLKPKPWGALETKTTVVDLKVAVMALSFLAAGLRVKALRLLLLRCMALFIQLAWSLSDTVQTQKMHLLKPSVKSYFSVFSRMTI
ncbi:flavin-containing monooxygenase 5-like isoform X2 [Rhipicephalus microplus]